MTGDLHNGNLQTPEDSSFGSPFPFEELMREIGSQPMAPTPPSPDRAEEEWLNTLLSVEKHSKSISKSRFGHLGQIPSGSGQVPRLLQDYSSILVEYYFKEVCGMMSCYDSEMNPYRTTISNYWQGSQALYYTTQGMAAACLSEVSPTLRTVGLQLQNQAALCLAQEAAEPEMEMASLLAVVMLGMSRCWYEAGNVGCSEFDMLAKNILASESYQASMATADKQKKFFFSNSLVYWQMLLAFVSDQEPSIELKRRAQPQPSRNNELQLRKPCMPHPQTGIAIQIQVLVAEVGSLVRKERKRIQSRRFSSKKDIEEAEEAIHRAMELHSELCNIQLPNESTILDSGDDMTPAQHLLKIAEAYRCTGLLQLYRNFPDLVSPYIPTIERENQAADSIDPFDMHISSDNDARTSSWLVCLALHILDLIQDIPVSSRSRSIQPLLLVSVCSDLELARVQHPFVGGGGTPVDSIASSRRFSTCPTNLDVLRARRFITSRLSAFENILAAKPIQTMLLLVKETWAQMEQTPGSVYWVDVMMENGYETLMG